MQSKSMCDKKFSHALSCLMSCPLTCHLFCENGIVRILREYGRIKIVNLSEENIGWVLKEFYHFNLGYISTTLELKHGFTILLSAFDFFDKAEFNPISASSCL